MKEISEFLQEADPVRHETHIPPERFLQLRHAVMTEAPAALPVAVKNGFPLFRLALIAAALLAVVIFGSRLWPRHIFETHASVLFEIRLAEDTPAAGLTEAKVDGKVIYLHAESVVSNDDIARTEVIPGNGPLEFRVGVNLTSEGARKMRFATASHLGKPIAILFDDEIVAAPTVRGVIGDAAMISGNFTGEEAERIANGLR
jgi:hypothetical protein